MKKKIFLLILILLFMSMKSIFCEKVSPKKFDDLYLQKNLSLKERQALRFLLTNMQNEDGLVYSWVSYNGSAHDSLLESIGQTMEYFALVEEASAFSSYAKIVDKNFLNSTGAYAWQIDVNSKEKSPVTAFVDDLRLIKTYFLAQQNNLGNYEKKIKHLSSKLYKFSVTKDYYLSDFYDSQHKQQAGELSLFYLDIDTLKGLQNLDKKWHKPYENALSILQDMPETETGFYPANLNLADNQFTWKQSVNMIENLYTALNAFAAGRSTDRFADFLKGEIQKGRLSNSYSLEGYADTDYESAAIYALAARFLSLHNDLVEASWCYQKALSYQLNEQSPFAGAVGTEETGMTYAFNQLEVLLMFRYAGSSLETSDN